MNQDDFRQMLASREADSEQRGYGGKRNLTEADLTDIKKLSAKKSKKKGKKPKNATSETEPHPAKSLYRDRAAERRKGGSGDMIDAEEYKHLDTEQSKFLGGDMEHTHLVKGLDYALLAQLKREKQKLLEEKHKRVERGFSGEVKQEMARKNDGKLSFKSRMGRLVYFHACQSTPETMTSVKSELFLPGRMYYAFNLSATEMDSIPVSVQRSKEDCPESDEVVSGIVDEALIERVKHVMNSTKSGKKLRKKKKEGQIQHGERREDAGEHEIDEDEPMATAEVEATVDDDEDIFPDTGDYVPIDQRTDDKFADAFKKEALKKAGYFSNLSASITEKEAAARKKEEDAELAWKTTLQKAVETQKKLEREKERKAKEAKMTGEADDYAEYQAVGALGDSDDEDDEETVRRRKAAGLSERKTDVDPEEKARRRKQKQSSKLANDLEKINKIMETNPTSKP